MLFSLHREGICSTEVSLGKRTFLVDAPHPGCRHQITSDITIVVFSFPFTRQGWHAELQLAVSFVSG